MEKKPWATESFNIFNGEQLCSFQQSSTWNSYRIEIPVGEQSCLSYSMDTLSFDAQFTFKMKNNLIIFAESGIITCSLADFETTIDSVISVSIPDESSESDCPELVKIGDECLNVKIERTGSCAAYQTGKCKAVEDLPQCEDISPGETINPYECVEAPDDFEQWQVNMGSPFTIAACCVSLVTPFDPKFQDRQSEEYKQLLNEIQEAGGAKSNIEKIEVFETEDGKTVVTVESQLYPCYGNMNCEDETAKREDLFSAIMEEVLVSLPATTTTEVAMLGEKTPEFQSELESQLEEENVIKPEEPEVEPFAEPELETPDEVVEFLEQDAGIIPMNIEQSVAAGTSETEAAPPKPTKAPFRTFDEEALEKALGEPMIQTITGYLISIDTCSIAANVYENEKLAKISGTPPFKLRIEGITQEQQEFIKIYKKEDDFGQFYIAMMIENWEAFAENGNWTSSLTIDVKDDVGRNGKVPVIFEPSSQCTSTVTTDVTEVISTGKVNVQTQFIFSRYNELENDLAGLENFLIDEYNAVFSGVNSIEKVSFSGVRPISENDDNAVCNSTLPCSAAAVQLLFSAAQSLLKGQSFEEVVEKGVRIVEDSFKKFVGRKMEEQFSAERATRSTERGFVTRAESIVSKEVLGYYSIPAAILFVYAVLIVFFCRRYQLTIRTAHGIVYNNGASILIRLIVVKGCVLLAANVVTIALESLRAFDYINGKSVNFRPVFSIKVLLILLLLISALVFALKIKAFLLFLDEISSAYAKYGCFVPKPRNLIQVVNIVMVIFLHDGLYKMVSYFFFARFKPPNICLTVIYFIQICIDVLLVILPLFLQTAMAIINMLIEPEFPARVLKVHIKKVIRNGLLFMPHATIFNVQIDFYRKILFKIKAYYETKLIAQHYKNSWQKIWDICFLVLIFTVMIAWRIVDIFLTITIQISGIVDFAVDQKRDEDERANRGGKVKWLAAEYYRKSPKVRSLAFHQRNETFRRSANETFDNCGALCGENGFANGLVKFMVEDTNLYENFKPRMNCADTNLQLDDQLDDPNSVNGTLPQLETFPNPLVPLPGCLNDLEKLYIALFVLMYATFLLLFFYRKRLGQLYNLKTTGLIGKIFGSERKAQCEHEACKDVDYIGKNLDKLNSEEIEKLAKKELNENWLPEEGDLML